MARVCAICGKRPSTGHSVSHSAVKTRRRFLPNLQRVRVLVNGAPRRLTVCTTCLSSGRVQRPRWRERGIAGTRERDLTTKSART